MPNHLIVDSNSGNRATLIHQLSFATPDHVMQFRDLAGVMDHLTSASQPFQGTLFLTFEENSEEILRFMNYLREAHPEGTVILISSHLFLEDMRDFVRFGVDQILLQPFSAQQIKDKMKIARQFRQQVLNENKSKPKMSSFEVHIAEMTPKFYRIALKGWLGENCELPDLYPTELDATLFIDGEQLLGMNSIGVRSWILWQKALSKSGFIHFEFENLRPSFLRQAALVHGFLPSNAAVNSFYLSYWCEELKDEKDFKFLRGKDFSTDVLKVPEIRMETRDKVELVYELDPQYTKLLKFFRGRIEVL